MANTNQPNPFFSLAPSILLFKKLPNIIPPVAKTTILANKEKSTEVWVRSPANPNRDLMVIINKEEAIAYFIGSLPKSTNAGIIKNPPPAPTIPVTSPSIIPTKTKVSP